MEAIEANQSWSKSNGSRQEALNHVLFDMYERNRAVSDTTYWLLILAYTLLIVGGSIGNLLVISVVITMKSE